MGGSGRTVVRCGWEPDKNNLIAGQILVGAGLKNVSVHTSTSKDQIIQRAKRSFCRGTSVVGDHTNVLC